MKELEIEKNINLSDEIFLRQIDAIMQEKKRTHLLVSLN
jgi:hypothetical protein